MLDKYFNIEIKFQAGVGVEGDNFVFEPVAALEKIHKVFICKNF